MFGVQLSARDVSFIERQLQTILDDIVPTPESESRRKKMFDHLSRLCSSIIPQSSIRLGGSAASGFAHKNSDLGAVFWNRLFILMTARFRSRMGHPE